MDLPKHNLEEDRESKLDTDEVIGPNDQEVMSYPYCKCCRILSENHDIMCLQNSLSRYTYLGKMSLLKVYLVGFFVYMI